MLPSTRRSTMHATKISKQTKGELLDLLRQRYRAAAKPDKGKILDEFVAVAGCHRKHAIRLLTAAPAADAAAPVVPRRTYDEAARQALIVLWEAGIASGSQTLTDADNAMTA